VLSRMKRRGLVLSRMNVGRLIRAIADETGCVFVLSRMSANHASRAGGNQPPINVGRGSIRTLL
jgi:hypothetical protein